MDPAFFGLPKTDDPGLAKYCAEQQLRLMQELRYISREVGLTEARRMPTEVRVWWINQMQREKAPEDYGEGRKVTKDVPRSK